MSTYTEHSSFKLLSAARTAAASSASQKYDSQQTRATIIKKFAEVFENKQPYDWQVDACEALLLELDCIVIAGTGAGKTFLFAMPLLMDMTCRKMVIVIIRHL